MNIENLIQAWRDMGLVSWAGHRYGWITESGEPIEFSTWQNVVLSEYLQRQDIVSTLFISSVKKTGKTLLNSIITTYRWLTIPSVHFVIGINKLFQIGHSVHHIFRDRRDIPCLLQRTSRRADPILRSPKFTRTFFFSSAILQQNSVCLPD